MSILILKMLFKRKLKNLIYNARLFLITAFKSVKFQVVSNTYCVYFKHKYEVLNEKNQPVKHWPLVQKLCRNRKGLICRCSSCGGSGVFDSNWILHKQVLFKPEKELVSG